MANDSNHKLLDAASPSMRILVIACICLAILPVILLIAMRDASWRIMTVGGLAWLLAVVAKVPLATLCHLTLSKSSRFVHGACQGIVSSAVELGIAAAVVVNETTFPLDSLDMLAYGTGAGVAELSFVLVLMPFCKPPDILVVQWIASAKNSVLIRQSLLVERAIALCGHVGARGLVCVTIGCGVLWPAALAVVTFAFTDGLAYYGQLAQWNWYAPRVFRNAYGTLALVSVAEIVAFWWAYHVFC